MPTQAEQLVHLATIMAKALVDRPDAVQVTVTAGGHTIVLEIRVHPDDVGKIVGRKGMHAQAMRRLMCAISGKLKRAVILEIVDPQRQTRYRPSSESVS